MRRLPDLRFRFSVGYPDAFGQEIAPGELQPAGTMLVPRDQLQEIPLEAGYVWSETPPVSELGDVLSIEDVVDGHDDPAALFLARQVFCPDCQTWWGDETREDVETCQGVQRCLACCNPPASKRRVMVDRFADVHARNDAIRLAALYGEPVKKIARDFGVSVRLVSDVAAGERAMLKDVTRFMVKGPLDEFDSPTVEGFFGGAIAESTVRHYRRGPEPDWVGEGLRSYLRACRTPEEAMAALETLCAAINLDIWAVPWPVSAVAA